MYHTPFELNTSAQSQMPTSEGFSLAPPSGTAAPDPMDLLSKLLGGFFDKVNPATGIKTPGYGLPAIQGAGALGNLFLGMKSYGLAKDQFSQSKKEFGMNWDANKRLTNASLEDRQNARVASQPGAYQSVFEYMQKNGIR